MEPTFIVYAPRFDRNSGGTLVLYDLARRLRDKGYEVTIWISDRPVFSSDYLRSIRWSIVRFMLRWLKYKRKRIELPHGLTETKRRESLRSIVIYPEVTSNNPLGIKNVVRWILYFPGVLSSSPTYGSSDLFFLFSKDFQNELVPQSAPVLFLPLINLDSYHKFNFSERQGNLVLFRKGGHRDHSFHPQTAQCIDGKSHEELCLLFNEASKLYSYDPYTAYTVFAAICGCIPIVIPIDGVSEEQWHPNLADRYGVAYGEDRVSFAIETRDLLLTELEKRERDTDQGLEDFLKVVLNNFFRGRETH